MLCGCGTPAPEGARFCPGCGRSFVDGAAASLGPGAGFATGATVAGKYCVLESLGVGGFGRVFRVQHLLLDRPFALKALHPELAEDASVRARFFREAKLLLDLQHPNLVTLREVGEWNGQLFIVMDLCAGPTLDSVLIDRRRLPVTEAITLGIQVLRALEYAHARGIVHRDLKPPNLILSPLANAPEGCWEVKVLDFGVAKVLSESQDGGPDFIALTARGTRVGTLGYMSPEQARGKPVDRRSDLYSLAAVLYHAVAGRPPFDDFDRAALTRRILSEPPPPFPDPSVTGAAAALEGVILRALAKDPADRPASAAAMLEALETAAAPRPRPATAGVTTEAGPAAAASSRPAPAAWPGSAAGPARRTLPALGVLGACLVLGLLGWSAFRREAGTGNRAPDSPRNGVGPAAGNVPRNAPVAAANLPERGADSAREARLRESRAALAQAQLAAREEGWEEARRLVVQSLVLEPGSEEAKALHDRALIEVGKEEAARREWSAVRPAAEAAIPRVGQSVGPHPYATALAVVDVWLAGHPKGATAQAARDFRRALEEREAVAVGSAVAEALEAAARAEAADDLDGAIARLEGARGFGSPRVESALTALEGKRRKRDEAARQAAETQRLAEERRLEQEETAQVAAEAKAAREKALQKAGYLKTKAGEWLHEKSGVTMVLIEPPSGRRSEPTRPYLLAKTETTNGQFRRFQKGHSSGQWSGIGLDSTDWPAVNLTFDDADAFCRWAGLRLASTEELTYAATGGDGRAYAWGNDWPPPSGAGNWNVKGVSDGARAASRVGGFSPSPLGVHDLTGNVQEWCVGRNDFGRFAAAYGGCWHDEDRAAARCNRRLGPSRGSKEAWLGFRAAADEP